MEQLFIYIDEAGNPNLNSFTSDDKHFSIGASFFTEKVSVEVTTRAMEALSNEKVELGKSDKNAINRGCFHASFDGPQAHSKLMTEVNKMNTDFYLVKFDKQIYSSANSKRFTTELDLHHHLISLVTGLGLNYKVQKITLVVAERGKSFPVGCEQNWINSFYNELVIASIALPQMKTPFPELTVEIVNGTNPGIQIADLILWATNRNFKELGADNRWFNRIHRGSQAIVTGENDPVEILDFYINEPLHQTGEEIFYCSVMPEFDRTDDEKFYNVITGIENFVRETYYHSVGIDHLKAYVKKAVENIERKEVLTLAEIIEICRAFLMIFDTDGYYDRVIDELKKEILLAKKIAAIIAGEYDPNIGEKWGSIHPHI